MIQFQGIVEHSPQVLNAGGEQTITRFALKTNNAALYSPSTRDSAAFRSNCGVVQKKILTNDDDIDSASFQSRLDSLSNSIDGLSVQQGSIAALVDKIVPVISEEGKRLRQIDELMLSSHRESGVYTVDIALWLISLLKEGIFQKITKSVGFSFLSFITHYLN